MFKDKSYSILVFFSLVFVAIIVIVSYVLVPSMPTINFLSLISKDTNLPSSSEGKLKIDENLDSYLVTDIVDGDTIKIDYYGKLESVRLIALDSPEMSGDKNTCYAQESKDFLYSKLSNKKIRLESDDKVSDRDRYNRLLRYVFLGDENINLQLILGGFAEEITYDPNYKYQREFKDAQLQAFNSKIGIWSQDCALK